VTDVSCVSVQHGATCRHARDDKRDVFIIRTQPHTHHKRKCGDHSLT